MDFQKCIAFIVLLFLINCSSISASKKKAVYVVAHPAPRPKPIKVQPVIIVKPVVVVKQKKHHHH